MCIRDRILTYSLDAQVTQKSIKCAVDNEGEKTIKFLDEVNKVLRNTPFELAYRALNELLLHVNCFSPSSDKELQSVWDDFLMTKVLPRIDGDEDKLRVMGDNESGNLLTQLQVILASQLGEIWSDDKERVDLLAEDENGDQIKDIKCRSRKKIRWMINRLESNTFTSYWP